jgi:hypothetical protein
LSIGIRNSISLLSAIQATRPLTITLVGLSPTEHTSLFLDTLPYGGVSPVRLEGRYFRRGLPADACSSRRAVCVRPACTSLPVRLILVLSRGARCAGTPPFKRHLPLYPRGPRSGPGYSVPVHPHLCGPMRPTRQRTSISPTRLIRDALAVRPTCDA